MRAVFDCLGHEASPPHSAECWAARMHSAPATPGLKRRASDPEALFMLRRVCMLVAPIGRPSAPSQLNEASLGEKFKPPRTLTEKMQQRSTCHVHNI